MKHGRDYIIDNNYRLIDWDDKRPWGIHIGAEQFTRAANPCRVEDDLRGKIQLLFVKSNSLTRSETCSGVGQLAILWKVHFQQLFLATHGIPSADRSEPNSQKYQSDHLLFRQGGEQIIQQDRTTDDDCACHPNRDSGWADSRFFALNLFRWK